MAGSLVAYRTPGISASSAASTANEDASRPRRTFALFNSGGVRSSMPAPNITLGTLMTAFPFGHEVVELVLTGTDVWDLLEGVASRVNKLGRVS